MKHSLTHLLAQPNLETHFMSALGAPASYEPASTLVQRIDANHADSARGP